MKIGHVAVASALSAGLATPTAHQAFNDAITRSINANVHYSLGECRWRR